ncbi:MAG: hypothetical protein IPF40_02890 [Actinomycetales bacterium]|uniref:Uncharacterized protein n=1 Tax=Candidatus Phosphoribacter hodrii TaxID=2953743 RepID=A0A934X446_9MICO|nr:hypothetical protein [Candidatus Phosphoribacter hodrii]
MHGQAADLEEERRERGGRVGDVGPECGAGGIRVLVGPLEQGGKRCPLTGFDGADDFGEQTLAGPGSDR